MKHGICFDPYDGLTEVLEELHRGEIVSTDLEIAIQTASSGSPTREGELLHTTEAVTLHCVRNMGFNLLALANNHAWDLGTEGVLTTREAVSQAGFGYAGTGTDWLAASAAGHNSSYPDVSLVAVAIGKIREGAAASTNRAGVNEIRMPQPGELHAGDVARNIAAIQKAHEAGQRVIVCLHNHEWGEYMALLPDWARQFAHSCIDAGADAFFSHGAPLLKGIEIYRGKPLLHGLGSLVFQTRKAIGFCAAEVWESAIVHLNFSETGLTEMEVVPVILNDQGDDPERHLLTRGRPRIARGTDATRILGRLQSLSEPLGVQLERREDKGWLKLVN